MPRKPRDFQRAVVYHVMNRGLNRRDIFVDDADRVRFAERVVEYAELTGARIYHWVWMTTHFHMLVEISYAKLRAFAGTLQQTYAQDFHRRHGTSGIFWEGRFKSKPVEIGEYLMRCGRYIERNPVRAGMVAAAEQFPWSSARFYVTGKSDGLTTANPYIGAQKKGFDREDYRAILASGADDAWMAEHNGKRVLGSAAFGEQFTREKGRERRRRGRPRLLPEAKG